MWRWLLDFFRRHASAVKVSDDERFVLLGPQEFGMKYFLVVERRSRDPLVLIREDVIDAQAWAEKIFADICITSQRK